MVEGSLIETGVDRLLNYVQDNGKVELKEASKALGVERDTAMKWASALEDSGLLEIRYSVRRGRILVPMEGEVTEEKVEEARQETADEISERGILEREESELEQYKDMLETVEESLKEDEKEAEDLKSELEGGNLQRLRGYLEELQETESEIEEIESDIEDILASLRVLEKMEEESVKEPNSERRGLKYRIKSLFSGKNRTFKCEECGREFDTERGLKTHQGMIHD
ncbi:MAG: hypothetical protein MUP63_00110 [Candidatus Nanohaloarchaeota archaeon QJJ-7]|nr:hypothetical protein [Candidatus Nanohaloarchaeota archaeon QJJ-7]